LRRFYLSYGVHCIIGILRTILLLLLVIIDITHTADTTYQSPTRISSLTPLPPVIRRSHVTVLDTSGVWVRAKAKYNCAPDGPTHCTYHGWRVEGRERSFDECSLMRTRAGFRPING